MNHQEKQLIKQLAYLLTSQITRCLAESQVLKEKVAGLISSSSGVSVSSVLSSIQDEVAQRQEKYLLAVEDSNPELAAWMDQFLSGGDKSDSTST